MKNSFTQNLNEFETHNPETRFPEARKLIKLARSYTAGEIHFSFVCSAAGEFRDAAKLYSAPPAIKKMADEWAMMAVRLWPGMLPIDNPISEDEFKRWVILQLQVFEKSDFPYIS
ncbi:hypothetical protein [Undibacterium sp. TC9W]|uniref:hypothetical protein n=1 Tax=Undibacterium sp. TC9W TaxID=3413053 RepID=UPI003BF16BFA